MANFIARRLLMAVGILLLVTMIGFTVLHMAPGGPMSQFAASSDLSAADIAAIEARMGLDRPVYIQYLDWVWRMVQGDWGASFRDQQPVLSVIGSHLGATFQLMIAATVLAVLLGGWIGVMGAIRRNSWFDSISTIASMIAISIPTFWFGLIVIYVFSIELQWLPSGNRYTAGDGSFWNYIHHLIAPSIVLALVSTATWSRYMRSSMLDAMSQDFVRTARSKGASESRILFGHILRNAMLPMITVAGLQLPMLLSGALVTETVFAWPGMGRLFLDSISYRDYPVVMGVLMFTAILVLLGSLLADLLYSVVDPRIREH
ncbi:ABC transporter permease [Paenalcaligenes sp. Me131]|uniref:ABC transporter permease n=1 Tax=Paenalcaligenes sp. Me131 TaxID=3392636 RepID=UPI003D26C6BF